MDKDYYSFLIQKQTEFLGANQLLIDSENDDTSFSALTKMFEIRAQISSMEVPEIFEKAREYLTRYLDLRIEVIKYSTDNKYLPILQEKLKEASIILHKFLLELRETKRNSANNEKNNSDPSIKEALKQDNRTSTIESNDQEHLHKKILRFSESENNYHRETEDKKNKSIHEDSLTKISFNNNSITKTIFTSIVIILVFFIIVYIFSSPTDRTDLIDFYSWVFQNWYQVLGGLAFMWIAYKITVAITPAVDNGMGGKVKRIRSKDVGCMFFLLAAIIISILTKFGLFE